MAFTWRTPALRTNRGDLKNGDRMGPLRGGLTTGRHRWYLEGMRHKADKRVTLGTGGRIVLPASIRRTLGVQPGDDILLRLEEDGSVRLLTRNAALLRLRALVNAHVPKRIVLSEELIAERKKDAHRE